ncbi:MAG: cadherin-like domain-containing protein, partial [Desulfomicrobium sp.]|nr:cadherin-like domain-containing protein [Desulfomicrobium sp.]
MFKNQGIVQPSDGNPREMEAVNGGSEPLNPDGQLLVAATDGLDADAADARDAAGAAAEVDFEIAMSALGALPENQVAGLKTVAATTSSSSASQVESEVFSSDTQIRQALGIHQASVGNTEFLDRATGDDFGMSEFREAGSFSALPGDDVAGRKSEDDIEWEGLAWFRISPEDESLLVIGTVDLGDMDEDTTMLITEAGLLAKAYAPGDGPLWVVDLRITDGSGDLADNGDGTWTFTPMADWNGNVALSYRISDGTSSVSANASLTVNPVNDAPTVAVNDTLLVDDLAAQSLAGSLSATDVDNDPADLEYRVTQAPVHGALLLDGVEITDFSQPVFTQADIDSGRVSFRFHTPQPGDEVQVIENDSFVFQITDGSLSTAETTFHIHNTTVQIWGTNGADDLTGAADFSREGVTFHVYGFDGNDTLRGGSGADLIDGGLGQDFVDYRDSASWVNVDLNIQDGLTAQSGGGEDNDALGDTLIGIEHIIGSNDATHGDVLTGNAGNNHLIGLDGDDTLIGGAGNDTLAGGAGADVLSGGTGTRDLADYSASTSWVNVDLNIQNGTTAQSGGGAGNHAEGDILTGIEDVNGSAHDDSILGNAAANVLYGYDGDDTIFGGGGNDTIHGGDGDDWIDGGSNDDSISGGAGNDTIFGGAGYDAIHGGD